MTTRRVEPAALGAALAGALGAWCAAGAITIESTASRIGVLPPLWVLALFCLISLALVVAGKVTARDASSLWCPLVSVLPWLPVPLPAAAMLWVGPPGLIVAATALALVVVRRVPPGLAAPARAVPVVAAVAALFVASAWWLSPRIPGGDEPHYLVIAQSLINDGDLRIEDNHRRREYASYVDGELKPDYLRRGKDGAIYSVHAPGLPALVAPAFFAGGYPGVVILLAVISAIGWLAVWRAALDVSDGDRTAATVATSAVGLSVPFFFQAFTIYPDGPAAVVVAIVVWVALSRHRKAGWRDAALCGVLLGLLPWLHTRYAAIAGALGLVVVLRQLWPVGDDVRPARVRMVASAALLAPAVISAALWFWSFQVIYGVWDPRAPYGHATDMRFARIPHGLTGLLLDQQFGLIPNAPVYLLAALGLGPLWRRRPRLACELLLVATPYLLAVAGFHMWWAGRSSPARFLVPVLLPFALPIAAWWVARPGRAARAAALTLLCVSLGITAVLVVVDHGALAYNSRDGHSLWLLAASKTVNLTFALPSLFQTEPLPAMMGGLAWFAVVSAGWLLLRWLDRPRIADGSFRAAAVATAVLVLTAGASAGWGMSGRAAADPGPGSLAVLGKACESGAVGVRTWPFAVASPQSLTTALTIPSASRREARESAQWVGFDVPPGRYEAQIESGIDVSGQIAIAVGRPDSVIATCAFEDQRPELARCPIALPAGASALFFTGDARLLRSATRLLVVSNGLEHASSCATRALRAVGADAVTLFVTRGRTWTEGRGLWTAGASAADLVAWTADDRPLLLRLRSGAAGNVAVRAGNWAEERRLAAGETWDVQVPRRTGDRAMALSVSTTASFQPAASDPGSLDYRTLGVWIEISTTSR